MTCSATSARYTAGCGIVILRCNAITRFIAAPWAGWFRSSKLGAEFRSLADSSEGNQSDDEEAKILVALIPSASSGGSRAGCQTAFCGKELLCGRLRKRLRGRCSPCSKVLTEIEGILGEAYRKVHGHGAKIKVSAGICGGLGGGKGRAAGYLLLAAAFADYLKSQTSQTSISCKNGHAGSRQAVVMAQLRRKLHDGRATSGHAHADQLASIPEVLVRAVRFSSNKNSLTKCATVRNFLCGTNSWLTIMFEVVQENR